MFAAIFTILVGITMVRCDISDYFPDMKGNLTKITWAHAVNNKTLLVEAIESKAMMLEADVVLGKLVDSAKLVDIPIMCHPPKNVSDLSLEMFIKQVTEHNKENKNIKLRKGIKLDFKSIEAFEESIKILQKTYAEIDYPVWINADILPGPGNSNTIPVNPNKFLSGSKTFLNSTLSIGWTTLYKEDYSYELQYIKEMLNIISINNVTQKITFPVRAGIASNSLTELKNLTDSVDNSTLTIWSANDDKVDINKLRELIIKVGVDKVYVDVPSELYDKLNLPSSSNKAVSLGLYLAFFSFIAIFVANKMSN